MAGGTNFYSLPAEIRHMIYNHLAPDVISVETGESSLTQEISTAFYSLLRCSRQIHAEAAPILYRSALLGPDPNIARRWLHDIGPNKLFIREIRLLYRCGEFRGACGDTSSAAAVPTAEAHGRRQRQLPARRRVKDQLQDDEDDDFDSQDISDPRGRFARSWTRLFAEMGSLPVSALSVVCLPTCMHDKNSTGERKNWQRKCLAFGNYTFLRDLHVALKGEHVRSLRLCGVFPALWIYFLKERLGLLWADGMPGHKLALSSRFFDCKMIKPVEKVVEDSLD
jgi:hypothetical protein